MLLCLIFTWLKRRGCAPDDHLCFYAALDAHFEVPLDIFTHHASDSGISATARSRRLPIMWEVCRSVMHAVGCAFATWPQFASVLLGGNLQTF